jgi:antitoxin component YwqK of YwqJK toxin-antitoxin module
MISETPKQEKTFYPSGALRYVYSLGQNGNPEGSFKEYYENGNIQAQGSYVSDRKEGLWHFFHDNGRLKAQGEFNLGYKNAKWIYTMNKFTGQLDWSIYIEPSQLFGINYPSEWQTDVDVEMKLFAAVEKTAQNDYGCNFSVLTQELSQSIILKEYFINSIQNQIQNYPQKVDLVIPISKKMIINDMEAFYSVMKTLNQFHQPINYVQFQLVNGLHLFVVNFFCLESKVSQYETIFDEIIFSFRSPF